MIRAGDILDGKYKILERIGSGGMSTVWLAMDTTLNKQWAIKEINKHTVEYRSTVNEDQTLSEIEIMKKLSHPALPRIVSVIDSANSLCVVMDYIEGQSLAEIIEMYGKQNAETVVPWILDICDIVNYLHHQDPPIIYRDMKPSNVMLSREGNIRIIDFGIAREYKAGQNDTVPLGTRGYASPEHFTQKTDARSDVYTIAATMYTLLTGLDPSQEPYKILQLREVDETLSTGLEKIITKATEQDPNLRYQSVQELANAISSYRELDDEHIKKLKKDIKKIKIKFLCSVLVAITGLSLIVGGNVLLNQNYKALMESTTIKDEQRADELKQAITLKPSDEEAYIELIKVYAKDSQFDEKEAAEFLSVYSEHKTSVAKNKEKFAEMNYEIGEAFLKYYTGTQDNSARAKLLAAEPYFKAAAEYKELEKRVLAEGYVFMADYYKTYVLADDSLIADDAGTDEYKKLLRKCNEISAELVNYKGNGKEKMQQITYQVMLNLLDSQRNDMAKAGLSELEITDIVKVLQNSIPESTKLKEQADELLKNIEMTYEMVNKEKNKK